MIGISACSSNFGRLPFGKGARCFGDGRSSLGPALQFSVAYISGSPHVATQRIREHNFWAYPGRFAVARCKGLFWSAVLLLASTSLAVAQRSASDGPATHVVVAGTYLSLNVNGGIVISSEQFVAQGFSIPTNAYARDAVIVLQFTGDQSFLVQFTDAIGPGTTQDNVLEQGQVQAVGNSSKGVALYVPLGVTLNPGNYYLVLSTTGSNVGGWPYFGSNGLPKYRPLPGTIGTTDSSFYGAYDGGEDPTFPPASVWSVQGDSPVEFQVRGTGQ
jgi:hypothetical protein